MFYKHKYFQLDTKSRKVYDENSKELNLTSNAFRVLAFLCKNKNVNITEIGEMLDYAKDYDENHIRQYRYKINTILGHNLVEYKNSIYSIVGEVREIKKLELKERITDLLQQDSIKSDIVFKDIKFNIYPAIIASVLLLLSFFDFPYAYFALLRWVVTAVAIYYGYFLYTTQKDKITWFWGLVVIAILFNPITPIYLYSKTIWNVIDIVTAIFLITLIIKLRLKKK